MDQKLKIAKEIESLQDKIENSHQWRNNFKLIRKIKWG